MQIKTPNDYNSLDFESIKRKWNICWRLLRPHTLTASFVPVIIGSLLALPGPHFRIDLFSAMLFACTLIQVATNMFNEYFDYIRGLDQKHSIGIAGAIVRDGIASEKILIASQYVLSVALVLGVYICYNTSFWLLPIGLSCLSVGYLYSGGPFPISETPFGELAAGTCMGFAIISLSYFIQTGSVSTQVILVSLPPSLLIGAILMANNIRDLKADKNHGRKTLAILLGKTNAIYCLAGMFILSYSSIIFLIAIDILPRWSLITYLSLPKAVQASKIFWRNNSPLTMMSGMVATAQTNTLFGLLLALGILFQYWSIPI